MKLTNAIVLVVPISASLCGLYGQAATSPVTTALQSSLHAMVGQNNVQDVTLSGQAEYIAGSDDETGSFTYRATAAGCSRTDLGLTSGTRSETRQPGNASPLGAWMGEDGVVHASVQHNLMSGYWWPFPALIVSDLLTDSSMVVTFVGQEGPLLHLSAYQQHAGASPGVNATLQQLTQFDLWLNASTLLPAQLSFNIHPDSNAGLNIPVVVQFSNYQTIGGILVPASAQKYVNSTLAIDAQIQSVGINTGLTSSVFSLQ